MVEAPLFEKAWNEAKVRIFRLESLPSYSVPEDMQVFEQWNSAKPIDNSKSVSSPSKKFEGPIDWMEKLDAASEKGLAIHRVRVFTLPLSEYLKYEIDFWKLSKSRGQHALFLDMEKYTQLTKNLDFKPRDFWLFDDKLVILFHYDANGSFVEEELVTEKAVVAKYVELEKTLMENSISMVPFLYNVKRA